MKSLNDITSELKSYASELNIQGTYGDIICKLLAYGIYTKNAEILPFLTEMSPQNSVRMNSRIYHATTFNYSVNRGSIPRITYINQTANKVATYYKGDLCTISNGYYFYYADNFKIEKAQLGLSYSIPLYIAGKKISTFSYSLDDLEGLDYFDIKVENLSEDVILTTIIDDEKEELNWTNDIYQFFRNEEYKYYIITLPTFAIRVFKRETDEWLSNLTVKVFTYNETYPSNLNIILPGFVTLTSNEDNHEEVVECVKRETNKDTILNSSLEFYSSNEYLATTTDLHNQLELSVLETFNSSGFYDITYKVGYVLVFFCIYERIADKYKQSNIEFIKEVYDSWTKTVEIVEDIIPIQIETFEKTIYVKVSSSSKISGTDLDNLSKTYATTYCNEVLWNSTLTKDITSLGSNACELYVENLESISEDDKYIRFYDDLEFYKKYDTGLPDIENQGSTIMVRGGLYPQLTFVLMSETIEDDKSKEI